jgi:hypothetical protein
VGTSAAALESIATATIRAMGRFMFVSLSYGVYVRRIGIIPQVRVKMRKRPRREASESRASVASPEAASSV